MVAGSRGSTKEEYYVNLGWKQEALEVLRGKWPRQREVLPCRRKGSSPIHRTPHAPHLQMHNRAQLHP